MGLDRSRGRLTWRMDLEWQVHACTWCRRNGGRMRICDSRNDAVIVIVGRRSSLSPDAPPLMG